MPTETVYGLAARIDSPEAIKKIFSVKARPFFDPLIVHVASIAQAKTCTTDWSDLSEFLAQSFWPGPLTLVMPKSDLVSDLITSGLTSVGLRWPQHPIAQELISRSGVPLAAPSANKFGRTSPTKAQHVKDEFNEAVFVLDGDSSAIGIESTVLSIKNQTKNKTEKQNNIYQLALLRKGAILKSEITKALSQTEFKYEWIEIVDKKESPGHMKHHYMPSISFVVFRNLDGRLDTTLDSCQQAEILKCSYLLNERLAALPDEIEGVKIIKPKSEIKKIEFLKLSRDPALAARELYSQLRAASLRSPDVLCFIQTQAHTGEMWESVFDRLYKAAALILD